jgi:hypothetical protein
MNHSRLDNISLEVTPGTADYSAAADYLSMYVYARNLNVAEVKGGVFRVLFAS